MVYIPFETIDDNITEFRERFSIFLAVPAGEGKYSLGSIPQTDVYIRDNEGIHNYAIHCVHLSVMDVGVVTALRFL